MADSINLSQNSGFFIVHRDTREVLYSDSLTSKAIPGLCAGSPCYRALGESKPCPDCPLDSLDQSSASLVYREELGVHVVALRLSGDEPRALIYYGELSLGERQKWLENGRYQAILKQNHTIAFEFDQETGEQFVSPFITDFLSGNYDGRLLSRVMLEDGVLHPSDAPRMIAFRDKMQSFSGNESILMRLKTIDGEYRWFRMSVCSYHDGQLGRAVLMGTISDVDEEVRLRERQRRLAQYDETTGIYHKVAFFLATGRCLKESPGSGYKMVVFDIDRFKLVNDLFGMPEGDRLLRFIGAKLASIVNDDEPYGRIRDDMFGMCLKRTDGEAVEALNALARALESYPLTCKLTLSAGICRISPNEQAAVNILCDRAVLALKTVKGNAVKWLAFYEDRLGAAMRQEQELIGDMHTGLSQGQFEVWFQPKNDLRSGRVLGAEALIRWRHPRKGLLLPGDFLPLFESNGLIAPLDEYVWEQTVRTLRRWVDMGLNPPPVSVNVSRIHLYDPLLTEKFTSLMNRYGLPTRLLEIELTESAYVENPNLGELMEQLKARGFTFLMDDFGSGYSSLNMLRSIPVDILKLDLHFLGGGEETGRIIMESIIQMARRLEIPVIAEGVETEEQVSFLKAAGCEMGQGYLYTKPVPASEFERRFLL